MMRFAAVTTLAACAGAFSCLVIAACTGDDPAIGHGTDDPDATLAHDAEPVDASEDTADAAPPSPYYIFFTTGRWNGKDVGGITTADGYCQAEADANRYPGTYQAWLSDNDPSHAFPSRVKGNGPWIETYDGRLVFPDRASLTDAPRSGVDHTGDGGLLFSSGFWTGTPIPGGDASAGSVTCNDWTADTSSVRGTSGQSGQLTKKWTYDNAHSCQEESAILCLRAD
ncbi:MAG: hypothetical protein JWP97_631 [Labilithrix sp.]|nr:hypothetical protein [Labilithrix sp.]